MHRFGRGRLALFYVLTIMFSTTVILTVGEAMITAECSRS